MKNSQNLITHWLIVCLIPALTLLFFFIFPASDSTQYLINGIILACEATFLFKFVLFEIIKHHLKQEYDLKKQKMGLFIPIVLLIIYLVYYFK